MVQETGSTNGQTYFVKKAFKSFFIPSFLSSLALAVGGLADCLFVGGKLGTLGLFAVTLGIPVYMLFTTVSLSLSVGGAIHYAGCLAKGDAAQGNRIFGNVLQCAFGIYAVISALGLVFLPQLLTLLGAGAPGTEAWNVSLSYVRVQLLLCPIMYLQGPFYQFVNSDGAPRLAAAALVVSNAIDIIFNYVFVVRLNLGAEGSVYSTGLGAACMLLICLCRLAQKKGCLRLTFSPFCFSTVWRAFKTGFASSAQYICQFAAVLLCNHLLMRFSGQQGVAVFGIIYNLQVLVACVYDALSMTVQPMASTFLGERNYGNIRQTLRISMRVSLLLSMILSVALLFFAPQVGVAFGLRGTAELAAGEIAIRIFAASVVPSGLNLLFLYYYQAIEQERLSLLIIVLRGLICFAPAGLFLIQFGTAVFWWAFLFCELATLVVLAAVNAVHRNWLYLPQNVLVFSTCFSNTDAKLGEVASEVEQYLVGINATPTQQYFVANAVEEVCSAIITGGFSDRQGYIQLTVVPLENGDVRLHIRDSAGAFNPFDLDTGKIDLQQGLCLEGLGIQMVKKKSKEFFYRQYAGFNTLVIRV